MANRDQFLGLMSQFGGRLEQLDGELGGLTSTRQVYAARVHARQSSEWIKNILGTGMSDYSGVVIETPVLDGLHHAMQEIEKRNFVSPHGMADTFITIDYALGQSYAWMQSKGIAAGLNIPPPSTYDKTFSVLPGDPDIPTDAAPAGFGFPRRTDRQDKDAASFLPGDPELPTDPEPDPTPKRRSDDFLP